MRDQFQRFIALPTVFSNAETIGCSSVSLPVNELQHWRMNRPYLPSAYSPQPFSSIIQFDLADGISRLLSVWGDAEGDFICELRVCVG